jgi:hypothetical protein
MFGRSNGTAPRDRSQSLDYRTFTAAFHDVLRAHNNDAILKQAAVVLLTGHPFDLFATPYERGQLSELRPIAPIAYEFVQRAAGDIASTSVPSRVIMWKSMPNVFGQDDAFGEGNRGISAASQLPRNCAPKKVRVKQRRWYASARTRSRKK